MKKMTSMERVLCALSHKEPDRVPFFLLPTMHGARELGLPLADYFASARNVVEGQWRLQRRFGHDCLFPFFYAAVEVEAWGAKVIFTEDGPPSCGEPIIASPEEISRLEPPRARDSAPLLKVLTAIRALADRAQGEVPVIGVVVSPFSLPVMQMGFSAYLDLMIERPDSFERLMAVNEEFCVDWANAQLAAGATAIVYFDPVSSTTIVPPEMARRTGLPIARRVISKIDGPCGFHPASGRILSIVDDIAELEVAVTAVSVEENLAEVKAKAAKRMAVLGNLNGIEMRRWSTEEAHEAVKEAIFAAADGGGFILSDNHGELPYQVPFEVLEAISDAVIRWGRYPLEKEP